MENLKKENNSSQLEKKRKHKLTEQKGRQKINQKILELKHLLPECKYVSTTKAAVLECAVNSLKNLQNTCNQLIILNKKLEMDNQILRDQLKLQGKIPYVNDYNLSTVNSLTSTYNISNESNISEKNIDNIHTHNNENFQYLSNINSNFNNDNMNENISLLNNKNSKVLGKINILSLSSQQQFQLQQQQQQQQQQNIKQNIDNKKTFPYSNFLELEEDNSFFLDPITYYDSYSSSISSDSSPEGIKNEENYDNNDNNYDLENNLKISKRKIFFIILFLLPLFVNVENFYVNHSSSNKSRILLNSLDYSIGDYKFFYFYYFEIARVIMYLLFGTLGLIWILNTFFWWNTLNEKNNIIIKKKVSIPKLTNIPTTTNLFFLNKK
jgi:hypothetical protein